MSAKNKKIINVKLNKEPEKLSIQNNNNIKMKEAPEFIKELFRDMLYASVRINSDIPEYLLMKDYTKYRNHLKYISHKNLSKGSDIRAIPFLYADIIYETMVENDTIDDVISLLSSINDFLFSIGKMNNPSQVKKFLREYPLYAKSSTNLLIFQKEGLTDELIKKSRVCFGPDSHVNSIKDVCSIFHIEGDLLNDTAVTRGINKIKQKLADFWKAKDPSMLPYIYADMFCMDDDSAFRKYGYTYEYQIGCPGGRYLTSLMSEYHFWMGQQNGNSGRKHLAQLADEAIDNYAFSLILQFFESIIYKHEEKNYSYPAVIKEEIITRANKSKEIPNKFTINRMIREYSDERMAAECFTAVCLAFISDSLKSFIEDHIELLGRKNNEDILKQIKQRASNEVREKNAEIKELKQRIDILEGRLATQKPVIINDQSSEKEIQEMRHIIASLTRDLEEKDAIINKLKESDKLKEDEAEQSESVQPSGIEVKPETYQKKVLFICQKPQICQALGDLFPNALFSDNCSISKASAKNVDLVVAISTEISHREYYRIKNKATAYNIPMIDTSFTNKIIIAEKIQEAFDNL